MSKLHELNALGQSPWLDYIRKDMVENGELAHLVEQGVRGVTSNPTIFENAIAKSDLYQKDIERLARENKSTTEIYDLLAFSDIQKAADVLRPVYDESNGADGFVSLEVPPDMCDNHQETITEAKRIFAAVNRPNLMVKVPSTQEGLLAITELISDGINVNVTLMFTQQDYLDVARAYIDGLEKRRSKGADISHVASVASVFVSRIDSAVESLVDDDLLKRLAGKAAIANTRKIYELFQKEFASPRFHDLLVHGAKVQRPLWASTGTKNKSLSDTLYVDELIGPDTVNTMPPATLEAFLSRGNPVVTVDQHREEDEAILALCEKQQINLVKIGDDLKQKGLASFAESFNHLVQTIDDVRKTAIQHN